MKRFYDLKCSSCGTVVERWIRLEEIPAEPCPKCGLKAMERKYSSFGTGSSCNVNHGSGGARWGG